MQHDVVLGMVLRDQITTGAVFSQDDYDPLTGPWRQQIRAIFPHDKDLFQLVSWPLPAGLAVRPDTGVPLRSSRPDQE
ncbi:hypothetical protein [Kocuria sp. CPCC 205263]|uniref:hypothetical protein n=1 Tax=Kocuria sp. CPCC 205263 TaxID=3073555 RepID=UPI0034D441B6